MSEAIRCPKCDAGKAYLYLKRVDTVYGKDEAVACRRCGAWLISRPVAGPGKKGSSSPRRSVQPGKVRPWSETPSVSCSLRGCKGTWREGKAKLPLCGTHRKRLSSYLASGGKNPPLLLVNGCWIERGHPLPGVPGERPPAAVKPSIARGGGRRRKGAVLGTCTHCRARRVAIVAWELCEACHEGYLRGEIRI